MHFNYSLYTALGVVSFINKTKAAILDQSKRTKKAFIKTF
jgi:hypothetical protein